jgi:hypothetical protein
MVCEVDFEVGREGSLLARTISGRCAMGSVLFVSALHRGASVVDIRGLSDFAGQMKVVAECKPPAGKTLGMLMAPASGDGFYVKRDERRLHLTSTFEKLFPEPCSEQSAVSS